MPIAMAKHMAMVDSTIDVISSVANGSLGSQILRFSAYVDMAHCTSKLFGKQKYVCSETMLNTSNKLQ